DANHRRRVAVSADDRSTGKVNGGGRAGEGQGRTSESPSAKRITEEVRQELVATALLIASQCERERARMLRARADQPSLRKTITRSTKMIKRSNPPTTPP